MKLARRHPLLTSAAWTLLAALAVVALLIPQASARPTNRVVKPTAQHSVTYAPTARIPYRAVNADPTQNYADLFLPADYSSRTNIPIAVLIHGGSWARGVTARSFNHLAHDLTTRGIAVYNVEYRRVGTGGGWPTTFTDVGTALDNLPLVAQRYPQIGLANSVLVGHSAGAQLAAWAGLRTTAEPALSLGAPRWIPSRIVSISGPLDMRMAARHGDSRIVRVLGGSPTAVASRYRTVDPMQVANRADASAPTFIAIHGTSDHVVSDLNSVLFMSEYLAHGGHGELRLLPGITHTSMFRGKSPTYASLVELIATAATTNPGPSVGRRSDDGQRAEPAEWQLSTPPQ